MMPFSPFSGANRTSPVAFVTYLRPYESLTMVSLLVRLGFTTAERHYEDDVDRLAADLRPDLIMAAVDPADTTSQQVISRFAQRSTALLVALVPPRTGDMRSLYAAGADLCLREGDHPDVLGARLRRIWDRVSSAGDRQDRGLEYGPLRFDFERCEVTWDGRQVQLSPTEFRVFACLASRTGAVLTAEELMKAVHDYSASPREAKNFAKVYVRRVRKKLEQAAGDPAVISNVRGFGYLLDLEASADGDEPGDAHQAAPARRVSA